MPDCKALCDTPVRHENLSITKTSLRSRVFVSTNNHKTTKEKIACGSFIKSKQKKFKALESPAELNMSCPCVDDDNKEEECALSYDDEVSLLRRNIIATELSTPQSDISMFRPIDMKHSKQKCSTPRAEKVLTKAVSSTPNQELFNISKLTRTVCTQTMYTLVTGDSEELDHNLKSFFMETPDERSILVSSCSGNSTESTPPSRYFHMNKMFNLENDSAQSKLKRKLSLRSKTMICSAMEKTRDLPDKKFTRHKSVDERRLVCNTYSTLPQQKTPSSCSEKAVHNPFEVDLHKRLGNTVFSPDVFSYVVSPSEDSESIRWTIEDISSINPVHIDEDFSFPSDDEDPERESRAQQEIDRYFSETHVVLSPYDLPRPYDKNAANDSKLNCRIEAVASTPQKVVPRDPIESKNATTQTVLTLPEVLSNELEESLNSYFKLFETDDFNLNASNLRRKLFFHSEDEPPSPVRFETHSSPITTDTWKMDRTPTPFIVAKNTRYFSPVSNREEFSSPEMSPVTPHSGPGMSSNHFIPTCKKILQLYFPGDSSHVEEVKDEKDCASAGMKPVVNSTVLAIGDSETGAASTLDTSVLPTSQDTGYNTEDSWRHGHATPTKPDPTYFLSSTMASSPTRPVQ